LLTRCFDTPRCIWPRTDRRSPIVVFLAPLVRSFDTHGSFNPWNLFWWLTSTPPQSSVTLPQAKISPASASILSTQTLVAPAFARSPTLNKQLDRDSRFGFTTCENQHRGQRTSPSRPDRPEPSTMPGFADSFWSNSDYAAGKLPRDVIDQRSVLMLTAVRRPRGPVWQAPAGCR
jgi:hypothetical protein